MERNTLTTIENLKVGDRFYAYSDNKETVLEIVKTIESSDPLKKAPKHQAIRPGIGFKINIAAGTDVVFLRHVNQSELI